MPTVLTLEALNTICLDGVFAFEASQPQLANIIKTQYNTGLRIEEVLEVGRWTKIPANKFRVQLAKRELTRAISRLDIPITSRKWYVDKYMPPIWTYSSVEYSLSKVLPIVKEENSDVRRITHLYRYRFVRQLQADGLTNAQIKTYMGWLNQSTADGYLNRVLYLYP